MERQNDAGARAKNDIYRMAGILMIITAASLVLHEFAISPYLAARRADDVLNRTGGSGDNDDQGGNNDSNGVIDFGIKMSDTQTVAPPPLPQDSLPTKGRKCC